jgi:Ca2+-transporting ATPase
LNLSSIPACSIAFEAEPTARNAMQRPPRRRDARLFNLRNLSASMLQGLIVLIGVAVLYRSVLAAGAGEGGARAIGFSALAIGNIALILSNRSREMLLWSSLKTQNTALWVVILGAMAGLCCRADHCPGSRLVPFEAVDSQYEWAFAAAFLPGLAL